MKDLTRGPVLPAVWLSRQAGFTLREVWHLSVATVLLEAGTSLWLLRIQFRERLGAAPRSAVDGNSPEEAAS